MIEQIHDAFKLKSQIINNPKDEEDSKLQNQGEKKLRGPANSELYHRSILEKIAEDPSILNRKADDDNEKTTAKETRPTETKEKNTENAPEKIVLYRGKGCSKCDQGYKGRMGIYEVLEIDTEIGDMIINHKSAEDIEEAATKRGMLTMQQDGFLKSLEGITTIEEVLRVTKE